MATFYDPGARVFGRSIVKLDKGLYKKAVCQAVELGYASVDEFVVHVLERELSKLREQNEAEELQERLKGLGYLD